eukprot:gene11108-12942_t
MVALNVEYNGGIVAIATGIAFIGAFAAISLCEQYRLASISKKSVNSVLLMGFAAVGFAGVGVWGMHYIAATSFKLTLDNGQEVPMRFNIGMLFVALVVVIICEYTGFYLCSTDSCFNKSKKEIIEIFISRASTTYTMAQIKQMGKFHILRIVCTHRLQRILLGGFIGGAGVAVMHYLGMMSMEFQGKMVYNPGLVALSVIVAVLSVIGGFWVFFRILSLFPSLDILRVACALNGMISLSGVHYIGLVSATYEFDPTMDPPDTSTTVSSYDLLVGILVASVVFCTIVQVYVLSDMRSWLLHTSAQLRSADHVILTLKKNTPSTRNNSNESTTPGAVARDLMKYLRKYNNASPDGVDNDGGTDLERGQARRPVRELSLYNDYSDEEEPSEINDANDRSKTPRRPLARVSPTNNNSGEHSDQINFQLTIPTPNSHSQSVNLRAKPKAGFNSQNSSGRGSTHSVSLRGVGVQVGCDSPLAASPLPFESEVPGDDRNDKQETNDNNVSVDAASGANAVGPITAEK